MYSHGYVFEKLTQAVYDLATGEGDIRSRIDKAYHRYWHIEEENFPEQLRERRARIENLLTRLPAPEGCIIPENIARMPVETAVEIASLMWEMYIVLSELESEKDKQ